MSDIKDALKLEQAKVEELLRRTSSEAQERIDKIKAEKALRGQFDSGARSRTTVHADSVRQMIDGHIEIRRELARLVPEIGSEQELSKLLILINEHVHGFERASEPFAEPNIQPLLARQREQEAARLKIHAKGKIEILKREFALKLHDSRESRAAVTVNTQGGAAFVNTGTIYGNVEQAIGSVNEAGYHHLADVLQRLTAEISKADELADERTTYLEQVEFIAQQATEPANSRRISIVKGLLMGLRERLQDAANIAQILSVAGPAIAAHFGFSWPH